MVEMRSRRSARGKDLGSVHERACVRRRQAHAQYRGVRQHAVSHAQRAVHQLCEKADGEQQHEFGGHENFLSRLSCNAVVNDARARPLYVGQPLCPGVQLRTIQMTCKRCATVRADNFRASGTGSTAPSVYRVGWFRYKNRSQDARCACNADRPQYTPHVRKLRTEALRLHENLLVRAAWLRAHPPSGERRRGDMAHATIKLIVPTGPGAATDVMARMLSDGVSRNLAQSMVVENVPGASGILAHQAVARAAPDCCLLTRLGWPSIRSRLGNCLTIRFTAVAMVCNHAPQMV